MVGIAENGHLGVSRESRVIRLELPSVSADPRDAD
jgi:hypothetical protein